MFPASLWVMTARVSDKVGMSAILADRRRRAVQRIVCYANCCSAPCSRPGKPRWFASNHARAAAPRLAC